MHISRPVQYRAIGALMLLLAVGATAWFLLLSNQERWLLFYSSSAEAFARQELQALSTNPIAAKQSRTPDEFIDYVITVDPKTKHVVFSSHDDHSLTLAFAPDERREGFISEGTTFVRINSNWFNA